MKQILQNLNSGETSVLEVPTPTIKPGHVKIKTNVSLISAGTERMLVDFGRANYLDKARQQPEKVAQVVRKVGTDGLAATYSTVKAKLDALQPLGYSNVGTVVEVGEGVDEFAVGDRVVSNGRHAEIVVVPRNLCAKIPDAVSDEQAAFTVVSSIGLQGIRLAQPTLGETFVVYGLGLIGMITAQILKANGCRVLGLDVSADRVESARALGVEAVDLSSGADPVATAVAFSGGEGIDGVIVTASAKTDEIMHNAAQMSRKRGRIVLVGVVGLKLNRSDFYEKELSFQVSCSYGPGRYDPFYEEQGNDYPRPFVRWTEQRNFLAVLDLMASGSLHTDDLVSARVPLENAQDAYEQIVQGSVVTVIIRYPEQVAFDARTIEDPDARAAQQSVDKGTPRVAVIGAGNFTRTRLAPALKSSGAVLDTVVSAQGLSSASIARKFGFRRNTNELDTVWNDEAINTVFITTRHGSHGTLVLDALRAGKNVFVEKPLTLDPQELDQIIEALAPADADEGPTPRLMVGFNRRFAPSVVRMKDMLRGRTQPLTAIYTANAGELPSDHWTQDPQDGGGRIIGEACHFVDVLQFLVGAPITSVTAVEMGPSPAVEVTQDKMTLNLAFADGSHASVHYFANGSKDFPKERIEVFSEGRILQNDNFRKLNVYGASDKSDGPLVRVSKLLKGQDKGHTQGFHSFVRAVRDGTPSPIPLDELVNTTRACFAALASAKNGHRVVVE